METNHVDNVSEESPSSRPTILYMLTTSFTVDWSRVSSRLASNPDEAAMRDRNGFAILHHALARLDPAPIEVVRALIDADRTAVLSRTNTGMTPLSIACWRRADLEVLNTLLDVEPLMANVPDRKGTYPLQALWESYRNTFPQRVSIWPHFRALLRASYSGSYQNDSGDDRILHAAAGSPWCCPFPVLRIAINRHRNQISVRDDQGRLPIHVATAASPNHPPHLPPGLAKEHAIKILQGVPNKTNELSGETDISILLRTHIGTVPNIDGRHPFFLAVGSGRTWDQGIESFLESHPSLLQSRDGLSGLFPFQFAAAKGSVGNVDTVFRLLKAAPHLVSAQDRSR
mmetsp:Transcript_56562/g.169171  ORF Transcript_56562/g.169171 Transcript_56562/m.169171 type:complete len:343 (-) Transcript_56562:168-1196(-)